MNFRERFSKLADAGYSGTLSFGESLSKHTYYRIGGPAAALAVPRSRADLEILGSVVAEGGSDFFVLGSGSNLLVSDFGFDGLVIKTSRLNLEIRALSETEIEIGASVAVSTLLRRAAQEGWGGLEFLAGVPGAMGGVVRMNAGTHLGEAKDRIRRVDALAIRSGEELSYSGAQLSFDYRRNLFLPQDAVVVATRWEITREDPATVKATIDETLARRKATQPLDHPSCGSVFKNPKAHGKHAWQVVDQLGLRGHRIGDAQFSEKHSNFIVNLGAATARDVRALIELAKRRSLAELGVPLEEEVMYVGSF